MIVDPASEVARIASVLGLKAPIAMTPTNQSLQEIDRLKHDPGADAAYDKLSLLHHNHRGAGGVASYRQVLPSGLIARIEQRFGDWLSAQGYL